MVARISADPLLVSFTDVTLSRLLPARLVTLKVTPLVADAGVISFTMGFCGTDVPFLTVNPFFMLPD